MLYVMCGLPGSGKSTFARWIGGYIVSTDKIRKFLTGKENDFSHDELVFHLAREIIKYFLARGEDVVYDATNLRRRQRKIIRNIAGFQPVILIWLDCPLPIALAQNAKRSWSVPESVIRKMAKNFEPPQKEEGFFIWRIPCIKRGMRAKTEKETFSRKQEENTKCLN